MNKAELIEIVASKHGIPKSKAGDILQTLLTTVQEAVLQGDKVVLVGFGTFEAVTAQPRMGHNPRTGERVRIDAVRRPKFVAGRTFRNAVRDGRLEAVEEM